MKRHIFRTVLAGLALAGSLTACNDVVTYNDGYDDGTTSYGPPVITGIYDAGDDENATPLHTADMKQMVKITGENLSEVKQVTVNGVDIPLNGMYATNKEAFMTIPRSIPKDMNSKMVYTTAKGETGYDFSISVPELKIEGLYNEFAQPGDTVQVLGDYFDLYGFSKEGGTASITMDGKAVAIDSLTESYMSVIIPETASDNSVLTLKWTAAGGTEQTRNIPFRQVSSILISDYLNAGLWDEGMKKYIVSGEEKGRPAPTVKDGQYIRIKGKFDAWGWNQILGCGFNYDNADVVAHPENYSFKFEVNSASSYPFYDSQSAGYLFSLNGGGNYAWNPSAESSFNTYNRWRTITLPLTAVASAGMASGWINFIFVMQPNAEWNVEHNFANFRIEKNNY